MYIAIFPTIMIFIIIPIKPTVERVFISVIYRFRTTLRNMRTLNASAKTSGHMILWLAGKPESLFLLSSYDKLAFLFVTVMLKSTNNLDQEELTSVILMSRHMAYTDHGVTANFLTHHWFMNFKLYNRIINVNIWIYLKLFFTNFVIL